MGTRINCVYGGGDTTVLFSARDNKFYSYMESASALHAQYGGKMYYKSRSGSSAAGYLLPKPEDNDLLIVDSYRTYCVDDNRPVNCIEDASKDGSLYYISVPRNRHGLDWDYPIVIVRRNYYPRYETIAMTHDTNIIKSWLLGDLFKLEKEKKERWKTLNMGIWIQPQDSVPYFYSVGIKYFVQVNSRTKFPNLKRFLNIPESDTGNLVKDGLENFKDNIDFLVTSKLQEKMRLYRYKNSIDYFYYEDFGYNTFFTKRVEDPYSIKGEVINGWCGDGTGLFWKRRYDNFIEIFVEMPREKMGLYEEGLSYYCEYEETVHVLEFFLHDITYWSEKLHKKLIYKAKKDLVSRRIYQFKHVKMEEILEAMKLPQNKDIILSVENSLDEGNCISGTQNFLRKYKLNEFASLEQLANHPKIKEMLSIWDFRKLVITVMYDEKEYSVAYSNFTISDDIDIVIITDSEDNGDSDEGEDNDEDR